jgi:hypothetical protein
MTVFIRAALLFFCLLLAAPCAFAGDHGLLRETAGVVQVHSRGAEDWVLVRRTPLQLAAGDSVRTGYGARAFVDCADGSRLELGASGEMALVEDSRYRVDAELAQGSLKVSAKTDSLRSFQLRTPVAVATLRGMKAEVAVEVFLGGRTVIDLHQGLLGVEDFHGSAVLLHPNERLEVDAGGMGNPNLMPAPGEMRRMRFHERMQRELALDLAKESEQSAAARELELEEYQAGKVFIDANGDLVRVEEFMLRPASNEFKLVVLNGTQAGLSYFYYLGTFNQSLPANLAIPFSQLAGAAGTAPSYWLTGFQAGWGTTRDTVVEIGQGGHPIDLNNDGDPGDQVSWLFNSSNNSYLNVSGQPVFETLFDRYGLYVDGTLKYGWSGNNVQSTADQQAALVTNTDPITGAFLPAPLPIQSVSVTYPDPAKLQQTVYASYSDGTFLQFSNQAFVYGGGAAGPTGATGPAFNAGLTAFNVEQGVTASEFDGRSIDLVIAPKTLLQTGLLP